MPGCLDTQNLDEPSNIKLAGYKIQGCIQKFSYWVDNKIKNNKHSLRSNTKSYDGKTH